jgi:hypothetical protein
LLLKTETIINGETGEGERGRGRGGQDINQLNRSQAVNHRPFPQPLFITSDREWGGARSKKNRKLERLTGEKYTEMKRVKWSPEVKHELMQFLRCCYIKVYSATTALQNGSCTYQCIS